MKSPAITCALTIGTTLYWCLIFILSTGVIPWKEGSTLSDALIAGVLLGVVGMIFSIITGYEWVAKE